MAILSPACCAPFLVAANFHSGLIEAYTQSFQPLAPPGSFTDPQLPAGYAPFNIQQVGSFVFVTYAVQDTAKHDPVNAAGNGIVNIFNLEGNFVGRFASNGRLNSPWGVVRASANFGQFSNDILIGNFGDGTINAFDPATGNSLGQMKDQTGTTITNASLWALVFGAGGTGDANTLYFTAGLANEGHGLFGAITAATAATLDYSLTATPQKCNRCGRRVENVYPDGYTRQWIRLRGYVVVRGSNGRDMHPESNDSNSGRRRGDQHADGDHLDLGTTLRPAHRNVACRHGLVWLLLR